MTAPDGPPRLARWLLGVVPAGAREFVTGDLDEEYRRYVRPERGRRAANRWYWSQVLRAVIHTRREPRVEVPSREGSEFWSGAVQDLRLTLRGLVRNRGFAALVLVTLGTGIGAATAIFSAVNEVLLRPLAFAEPERLVMVWESNQERGWHQVHAAPANAFAWRERVPAFADLALVSDYTSEVSLSGSDGPVQVVRGQVSGNAFTVLGNPPLVGRVFRDDETWERPVPGVVLSHGLWQRLFGADPEVVGRTVRLDGFTHEVLGVMGPDFRYAIGDVDLWTTFQWPRSLSEGIWFRQAHVVRVIARLAPGYTREEAAAQLAGVAADLERERPATNRSMKAGITPLHAFLVGDQRTPLLLLLGAVGVLQLIACANVANLFLARVVGRRQELALRAALGAGRGRIVRQVLTESATIAVLGAVAGIGLGVFGISAIDALRPAELPGVAFRLDLRLLGFTALVALGSAAGFGVLPALRSARVDVAGQLKEQGRTGTGSRQRLLAAHGLIALEVGLAMVLVVAAGLMLRTLDALRRVDPGVDVAGVLTFDVRPPQGSYPRGGDRAEFALALQERIRGLPGVEGVGVARTLPYRGFGWTSDFALEGWGPDEYGTDVRHREVTSGYFDVFRVPVLEGELFADRLAPDEAVPVVVNEAFADRYVPDGSPVGRRIAFDRTPGPESYWYRITAVVGNERMSVVQEPEPEIIAHLRGDTPSTLRVVVRADVPPLSLVAPIRAALAGIDADVPLVHARTMDDVAAEAMVTERFMLALFGAFATAALVLAAVGVYGVAAQAARSRVREVGIRLALGAPRSSVVRALLTRGVVFTLVGLSVGAVAALGGARLFRGLLYGVEPADPLTFGLTAVVLAGVAALSSAVPAWRATRTDPVSVLRAE